MPESIRTLDRYTYTYDRAGNRTSRNNELHSAFDEDYTYNGLDELISSSRADDFDQSWTLDGLGNFSAFDDDGTTQTRTANGANEITAITGGWASPVYDLAGNMTTVPAPQSGDPDHALSAKYDAWNRLVQLSDGGVLVARFSYDGTGRRIEKLTDFVEGVPQDATHYFLSGQQVIETRAGSPASSPESLNPEYQNVWSPRYIDSLVLRDTYSGGVLQVDSRLYYLADANYNVTALVGKVSSVWQVVERYLYTPYGKATILDPDFSADADNTSDFSNATLYTGRELDLETSLYYYRARYYSPDLGSFIGRDPIGLAPDANSYRYCGNAPTLATDSNGLDGSGFGCALMMARDCQRYGPTMRPSPPTEPGFYVCRRDIQGIGAGAGGCKAQCGNAIATAVINACFAQHVYLQWGPLDGEGKPLPGTVGAGIGGGGVGQKPTGEGFFRPSSCFRLRKTTNKSDAEIWKCIANHRMTRPYSPYGFNRYNCEDWAKEAAKACGLKDPGEGIVPWE